MANNKDWTLLVHCSRGLKFFRSNFSGKIAVADSSGYYPDQTEDGVLWLDTSARPVIDESDNGSMRLVLSVTSERDNKRYYVGESVSNLLMLTSILSLGRVKSNSVTFNDIEQYFVKYPPIKDTSEPG